MCTLLALMYPCLYKGIRLVVIRLITNLDDYLNYKHTYTGNLASIDYIDKVEMV